MPHLRRVAIVVALLILATASNTSALGAKRSGGIARRLSTAARVWIAEVAR